MLKLKMMPRWWCCRWSPLPKRTSKQSVSQCEATTASGVDNAASPRLADTAERDYFTLERGMTTVQKQLEGNPNTRAVQIELPISMGNSCNYCEHSRFQRSIMFKGETGAIHLRMFAGFCLTTFSAPPQILAASTVFFFTPPRNENDGDGFWCYCCRFVLNSKRLLTIRNKQGQQ